MLAGIDDIKAGSLVASLAILFFPVTLLGMYSPFAIRLLLRSAQNSGMVSGTVYGISTAGSIVGTLGTTFYPASRPSARAPSPSRSASPASSPASSWSRLPRCSGATASALLLAAVLALPVLDRRRSRAPRTSSTTPRARPCSSASDGQIAHIETEYNDIFITKRRNELTMSFQLKGWDYTESMTNLARPRRSAGRATRASMTLAVLYPPERRSAS